MKVSDSPEKLLLIPGHLCTRDLWKFQEKALQQTIPCIFPEIPHSVSIHEMAKRILDQAPDTFAVAGLSMGGIIAFEIIRLAPDRVSKLALLDTSPLPDSKERKEQRIQFLKQAESKGFEKAVNQLWLPLMLSEKGRRNHELNDLVIRMANRVGMKQCIEQIEALWGRQDSSNLLSSIQCPTLLICGEQDALTPPGIHLQMAEKIKLSKLEIIPECGHLTTLEAPDEVCRLMTELINERGL